MSGRLVRKLIQRLLPWALTMLRSKRMRWRWTSIYSLRRNRTRFSNREKEKPRRPRIRLRRKPRRPRTRQKGKPRKVKEQVSRRQWLPLVFHLC
jgi:hypothetical protein